MGRNSRNKRHNHYRYVSRSAIEKQKRLKVAKQIVEQQIFTGEIAEVSQKPKVLTKIGNTWVVS